MSLKVDLKVLQTLCERKSGVGSVSFKIRSGTSIHAFFERGVAKNDHCSDVPYQPYLLLRLLGYDLGFYLKFYRLKSYLCHWLYHFEYYKFGVYSKDIT